MIHTVTQFGETTSGLGALGVDGKAFIIQLITFVLAFLVLRRFAFKPILKVLDERRRTIESGVELGEQMKKEKARLQQQVEKQLHEARAKSDAIVSEAQEASRARVREAEDAARAKAAGILAEADQRIASDYQRARGRLETELVSLISDATETIIGEKVDATKDAKLIERALRGQKPAAARAAAQGQNA